MIRPWTPASIIASRWASVARRSSDWSGWNWVVAAGKTPLPVHGHEHGSSEFSRDPVTADRLWRVPRILLYHHGVFDLHPGVRRGAWGVISPVYIH